MGRGKKRRKKERVDPIPPTCYCGSPMKLVKGLFGPGWFWGCVNYPKCDGTATWLPYEANQPEPAPRETRDARKRAHKQLDRLMAEGVMGKKGAYNCMKQVLQLPKQRAHIRYLNAAQCDEFCAWVDKIIDKHKKRRVQHEHHGHVRCKPNVTSTVDIANEAC